ncbi:MAG: hypothetical protein K8I30_08210 [Anaerolineae bacterium]|nr:hypothetical protein [Anaerolineae bacterium]
MSPSKFMKIIESVAAGLAIAVCIVFSPLLRIWYNRWGATRAELERAQPGDERVVRPRLGYTRAVTIRAIPAQIWPWLVQLGQERGGLYSYEPLENLIGCQMRNADRIIPEWQHLDIGSTMRLGPKGYPLFKVVVVEPERLIVFAGADVKSEEVLPITDPMPETYVNCAWSFYLVPSADGTTRLIAHSRTDFEPPNFFNWLLWRVFIEPINFVMERKTLLGIKVRAEGTLVHPEGQTARLALD